MPITTAGRDAIAGLIIGSGTNFSNTNARLGVGDSSTAFAVGQTDLQAATNKLRKSTDSVNVSTNVITAVATFASGDANWAWNEVGYFNAASGATMLSRYVPGASLGTKASGATWVLTYTLTLTLA